MVKNQTKSPDAGKRRALTAVDRPSANFDSRGGAPIDILLFHYTGMASGSAALARLCDERARVSSHYLVEEDGRVFRLVDEDARAWHAGVACWAGETNINARSIGIEIVNPGHEFGYRDFPDAQVGAVIDLARGILARHSIPSHRVLAHSDVAPQRKSDPGERFPWGRLAAAGIGWWPEALCGRSPEFRPAADGFLSHLEAIGYDVARLEGSAAAIRAFQRHFHPLAIGSRAEGHPDEATAAVAAALAKLCGA